MGIDSWHREGVVNTNEAFKLGAVKLVSEMSWDSIEFLFKPTNAGELLLRLDFEGFKEKVYEAFGTNAPDAMPHRYQLKMLLAQIRIYQTI